MARKYSVAEIDEMRNYLVWMSHMGAAKNVEDQLRTYMLNGTKPSELKAAHAKWLASWKESQRFAATQWEAERRFLAASADTLPKGRDAKQGSVRSKGSAVPKADAQ